MRLTLSDEWGYSERALAKSSARIGLLIASAKALYLCAFFSPVFCYGGLNGGASARRTRDGKTNLVQSATLLIGLNGGSSQTFHEDTTMSKDTQVTPSSNVTYLPAIKSARKKSLLDKFADNFNDLTLQDQADVAYQIYLYYQRNANRINQTNIKYLPLHGGVNYE